MEEKEDYMSTYRDISNELYEIKWKWIETPVGEAPKILDIIHGKVNTSVKTGTNLYEALSVLFLCDKLYEVKGSPPPALELIINKCIIPQLKEAAEKDPNGAVKAIPLDMSKLPDMTNDMKLALLEHLKPHIISKE